MLLDRKRFQECQLEPVVATCDDLRVLPHCVDLEVFGVNFFATDFKQVDDFFPGTAAFKVLVHCTLLVFPCMLHGTVRQGGFCLADV